jgi:vancomycin permeability regulator SanA
LNKKLNLDNLSELNKIIYIRVNKALIILLAIIEIISVIVLTYIRYKNQSLNVSKFELLKTGNLISVLFLTFILVIIALLIKNSSGPGRSALIILSFLGAIGIACLYLADNYQEKQIRITFSSIHLVLNTIIFSAIAINYFNKSGKSSIFKTAILSVTIFLLSTGIRFLKIYTYNDDSSIYSGGNIKADAGAILGAAVWGGNRPSPVLRERINKGYELYSRKIIPKLILTGGGSPNEMTEAAVARQELIKYGVNKNDLISENQSNSTKEQIIFIRDKLYRKNNWKKIIIISDNFHLFRASEICSFNDMNVNTIATDTPLSTEGEFARSLRECLAVIIYWIYGIG